MICKLPFLHRFLNKNTQESGRSMVEILGVLAVIGVLSAGGIYGYSFAMDKYRANDIINAATSRSADIWNRYQDMDLPNTDENQDAFSEWNGLTETGFPISIETIPDIGAFQIIVDDVPSGVCKQVLHMASAIQNINGIRFVHVDNDGTIGGIDLCAGDSVKTTLFTALLYDTNEEGEEIGECIYDEDCSSPCTETASSCDVEHGYICSNGCDGSNKICIEETGICEEIKGCTSDEFRSITGQCVSCFAKGSYEISSQDEPFIDEALSIQDLSSGKEQCSACGRTVEESNGKTYCHNLCLVGKGYIPQVGISNSSYQQYAENDYKNGCVSCNNPYDYAIVGDAVSITGCTTCGHSTYVNPVYGYSTICGPMICETGEYKYFKHTNGSGSYGAQCASCTDRVPRLIGSIEKFSKMCEACNRQKVGDYCMPNCSTNEFTSATYRVPATPNMGSEGSCVDCESNQSFIVGIYTESTDTTTGEKNYTINDVAYQYYIDSCLKCNDVNKDGVISSDEKDKIRKIKRENNYAHCVLSKNPCEDNQFLGSDGTCYTCGEWAYIISDEESGCTQRCTGENGTVKAWVISNSSLSICMKQACNEGTQVQSWYSNKCHDCQETGYIGIGAANGGVWKELATMCQKCHTAERAVMKTSCYKVETCGNNETFQSSENGTCISCDKEGMDYSEDEINCEACPPQKDSNGNYLHLGRSYFPFVKGKTNPHCAIKKPGQYSICNSLGDAKGKDPYKAGDGILFRGNDAVCYPCDTDKSVNIGNFPEQCKSCGSQRRLSGTSCQINDGCNGGSTFWSISSHNCVNCSVSQIKVQTTLDELDLCDQCSTRRSMKLWEDNIETAYCVKKCNVNKWQDVNGNCWDCDADNGLNNQIGHDNISISLCQACNRTPSTNNGTTTCQ